MSRSPCARRPSRPAARRSRRLMLEPLEDRVVLTGTIIPYGYVPNGIHNAYNRLVGQPEGGGQTIAIVVAKNDPNIVGDLTGFSKYFGLPTPGNGFTFKVLNGGGEPTPLPPTGDAAFDGRGGPRRGMGARGRAVREYRPDRV